MLLNHGGRWDEHKTQVDVSTTKGDYQQDGVQGQIILQEPELYEAEHAKNDAAASDDDERNLHDEENLGSIKIQEANLMRIRNK